MSLVTVQRSPSVAGSPQCSNSDGEVDEDEGNKPEKSECFLAGKGTALVLALKNIPQYAERRLSTDSTRSTNSTQSNNSDIQQHLQSMFNLLHHEETLKMAVKLESQRPNRTRYLVIVSRCCYRSTTTERRKIMRHNSAKGAATTSAQLLNTANVVAVAMNSGGVTSVSTQRQLSMDNHKTTSQQSQTTAEDAIVAPRLSSSTSPNLCSLHRQSIKCDGDKENVSTGAGDSKSTAGIEESCLLGIDCNERSTIGLVVPILADTTIRLDGDGGFSVSVYGKTHILKPVSVQAMWSALQTLHKVSKKARDNNFYPGGPSHDWLAYYDRHIESDQSCLNEWNAMDSLESRRPPSPDAIRNKPTAKEETESVIKMKLKEIMMSVDLDEVTSKYIRGRLEEILDMDLGEYKSFIDEEMLMILGQMDAPTEIFDHVYLGSEWNASNLEELQRNGVHHILNVTREIDNFFPGMFNYFNVRVYDDEKTNLLKHWDNTYRYITRAKAEGSKVLVHCKMGVSRSASVVIAYAMKAYNWKFERALDHVKGLRSCIKPNKNFLNQLETYNGMLDAMKNKEKLQRSKSETNLKSTKDARLLPGSEPTPLIQALNQAKSKSSAGEDAVIGSGMGDEEPDLGRITQRRSNAQKHRRLVRRSSSTSPKTQTAIVMKQQSQSLENLTPERSIADEPKNMRFPGSNGENYSVTQNQVLHIQKHTPTTSVRTRVHDLEVHQQFGGLGRLASLQDVPRESKAAELHQQADHHQKDSLNSPVWTSSAKLITQTSNLGATRRDSLTSDVFSTQVDNVFAKEEQQKPQRRKTHSWTETSGTSGGIILDVAPATNTILRTRTARNREPLRHASWGSGDNRCSLPLRNSSWSYYDTNRNATAIFEGQIHELKTDVLLSNKTASNSNNTSSGQMHAGTVKRTKQKLEESTAQKKLCQENGDDSSGADEALKRNSNLYRSVSAVGATRTRVPIRCNSEELVNNATGSGNNQVIVVRRSDGSRPFPADLYSASAPVSYTTSDIENKNTASEIETATVLLRGQTASTLPVAEDQRISGNVQILKQSFEAKAVGGSSGGGTTSVLNAVTGCATLTTTSSANTTCTTTSAATAKKTHQSLPSSPVAQHADHLAQNRNSTAALIVATAVSTAVTTATTTNATPLSSSASSSCSSTSSSSSSNCSASSVSESCDRNVKGLVHKYQTTTTSSSSTTNAAAVQQTASSSATITTITTSSAKATTRPRSYYDRSFSMKTHDFSDSRPPPAPARIAPNSNSMHMTDSNLAQQQQQQQPQPLRRLAQHGKTHPLTRLSQPKQSFNAAAYNTM